MEHMNHNEMMAGHDHSGHDHGSHADPTSCGHGGGHAMVFHAGVQQEILFRGWETTTALELFGSAVAIFLASVLYEGFKYYREALHANAVTPTADSQVNIAKNECGARGTCSGPAIVKYGMFSSAHFVQTCLHVVQSTVSYVLMLVFMTYNVWLCLALVLGLGVGYFCFGWKKSTVVDTNEHCQ